MLAAAGVTQPATILRYRRRLLYELWNRWNLTDPLAFPGSGVKRQVHGADVLHAPSVAVPPRNRVPLVVTVHDAAPLLFPDTYTRRRPPVPRAGVHRRHGPGRRDRRADGGGGRRGGRAHGHRP